MPFQQNINQRSRTTPEGYRRLQWNEYFNPANWGKNYVPIAGASQMQNIQGQQGAGPGMAVTPGAAPGTPGGATIPGTTPLGLIGQPPSQGFWQDGKPYNLLYQQYFPYQQEAMQAALSQAQQGMRNAPLGFESIANAAREGFQQQTLPSILERFNALGGERSSALPQILGSAARGFESDLASQNAQYNLAQNELLQRLLGIGLTPQVSNLNAQGQPGPGANLIGQLSSLGGTAANFSRAVAPFI